MTLDPSRARRHGLRIWAAFAGLIVLGLAGAYVILVDLNGPTAFMKPDVGQTRAEVLRRIPLGTPIHEAADTMRNGGFRCQPLRTARYADVPDPSGKQVSRGPANILWCDSGERSSGFALVSKRWQVSFEDVEDRVAFVAIGVGLTGP